MLEVTLNIVWGFQCRSVFHWIYSLGAQTRETAGFMRFWMSKIQNEFIPCQFLSWIFFVSDFFLPKLTHEALNTRISVEEDIEFDFKNVNNDEPANISDREVFREEDELSKESQRRHYAQDGHKSSRKRAKFYQSRDSAELSSPTQFDFFVPSGVALITR